MGRVPFITDWGFSDEVAQARPLVAVGFIFRSKRRHRDFLKRLHKLADSYEPEVAFRGVDLGENPSLIARLGLKDAPALVFLSHGTPLTRRWEGRVGFEEVRDTVDQLLRTLGESG